MSVLAEKRAKAVSLSAEIRKQGEAYQERQKASEKDPTVSLWPDETRSAWDKVNAEYDSLRNEIQKLEEDATVSARINQINEWEERSQSHGKQKPGLDDMNPSTGRDYGEDFEDRDEARSFAQRQADGRQFVRSFIVSHVNPDLIDRRMKEACERLGVDANRSSIRCKLLETDQLKRLQRSARHCNQTQLSERLEQEQRAMSKGGVGSGSELIPITFINTLELAMLATSAFFAHIDIMRTETGEPIKWPIGDDTANEGEQIGEATDINALAQPDAVLQQLMLGAYDFTSKFIKVSEQLSRDSLPNIDLVVASLIGERLGKIKLRRATLGNGTTQPGGIVTMAAAGVTSAVAAAIGPDDTVKLQHSVDPN